MRDDTQRQNTDRHDLEAYLAGDTRAFQSFYERHRRELYVYILSFVARRETADDVLQETFVTFLRQIDSLIARDDDVRDFRPFVLRIARSRAIDELRRARRRVATIEERLVADPFFRRRAELGVADAALDGLEATDEASALLRDLPSEQREVVVLKTLVGMTYPAIAELTGVPEKTVVSRFRYGIEKIRTRVGVRGACDDV